MQCDGIELAIGSTCRGSRLGAMLSWPIFLGTENATMDEELNRMANNRKKDVVSNSILLVLLPKTICTPGEPKTLRQL